MAEKSSMIKLGGLWKHEDKNGEECFSCPYTYATNLRIYKNSYKKKSNEPDYNIYIVQKEKKEDGVKAEVKSEEEVPF